MLNVPVCVDCTYKTGCVERLAMQRAYQGLLVTSERIHIWVEHRVLHRKLTLSQQANEPVHFCVFVKHRPFTRSSQSQSFATGEREICWKVLRF